MFKAIASALGVFLGILVIAFVLQLAGLASFGFFAPREETIKRHTYENSRTYNQGNIDALEHERVEYAAADSLARVSMAPIILQEMTSFGVDRLPSDLRSFHDQLVNGGN